MRDMIKMVVVLTLLSTLSGGLLAALQNGTKEKIEVQKLNFVQGPAVKTIFTGSSNDPISDRFKLSVNEKDTTFFIGKFDDQAKTIAFETFGNGYNGAVGLMVGINLEDDKIIGVGVTTHGETPGLGARAKTETGFTDQFKGLVIDQKFEVKKDGGQVDVLSGATLTSRAVAEAATKASTIYKEFKPQIEDKIKEMNQGE